MTNKELVNSIFMKVIDIPMNTDDILDYEPEALYHTAHGAYLMKDEIVMMLANLNDIDIQDDVTNKKCVETIIDKIHGLSIEDDDISFIPMHLLQLARGAVSIQKTVIDMLTDMITPEKEASDE